MSNSIQINMSVNFKYSGVEIIEMEDFELLCEREDVYYDERMELVSVNTNWRDVQWYYNYLETTAAMAVKNSEAYATYLLDLGYIPVVYVPTCAKNVIVSMLNVLNTLNIPFIRVKSTSFSKKYFVSDMHDSWVHKFDIERILGIPVSEITSKEVVRRLYG